MALLEIAETHVLQRCARCDSTNRSALDSLEVGVARRENVDDGLVQLPPCASCRSSEFLIRAAEGEPEHPAPGSFGHLHRLLVGHLHAELVQRGRLHRALKPKGGSAPQVVTHPLSQEARERWFPQGLRIAVLADEQPRTPEESSQ
ncbi:hypothetical protein [Corallococcus carmarthensis]|uniref:Uncharacterized protein n=1 Tax=Corallococcus carmarthensis TaxID=2316728 RepID=A0A3A8KQV5_9BACT|nr:hypothetical protein [Corallococcus carmarthensis]RKH04354.1 hypothetical protein D7X32_10995 [Corallococcus carmarthensis]